MAKKKKAKVIKMLSPENYIRQKARTLPIHECWINSGWEENGLVNIIVSRKHTNGNFTLGVYLVDLKCLGVKDTHYFFNVFPIEYNELLDLTRENFDIEKTEYALAHNIVFAGIEYAEEYGFKPHKDFGVVQYILEEDTDDIELIDVECGYNGKPFYLRGPNESDAQAAQIIAQLEKTAGPGNYNFADDLDDDFWDEGEDAAQESNPDFDDFLDFDEDDILDSQTFQFRIQIEGITNPPVWRKVTVPSYFSFQHFHLVIQAAFQWENYHLFQFSEKGFRSDTVISETYEDMDSGYQQIIESEDIKLSDVFRKEKQKLIYIYDFGDSWTHKITLEKILPEITTIPRCTNGKGKCPPEDCGGFWGYQNLKQILDDKTHPEHEGFLDWLGLEEGKDWNPNEFHLQETQDILNLVFTKS